MWQELTNGGMEKDALQVDTIRQALLIIILLHPFHIA
jgi:hypothetical protein